MVRVEMKVPFLGKSDFGFQNPLIATIKKVDFKLTDKGNDIRVTLVLSDSSERVMDIYSDNLRTLVALFTAESDAWCGKRIRIEGTETVSNKNGKEVFMRKIVGVA